jgi:uncharacterized DUF497 family protein
MPGDDLFEDEAFSWFRHKAAANIIKHDGVTFEQAKLVFSDYLLVELGEDRRANYGEQRFNVIGRSGDKLLFVTHAIRGDLIHIISARLAEKHERRFWNRENSSDAD